MDIQKNAIGRLALLSKSTFQLNSHVTLKIEAKGNNEG